MVQNLEVQTLEMVQILEVQNPEVQILEAQNPEVQILEAQNPEVQILEVQILEVQILEAQNPEVQNPEVQSLESGQIPETVLPLYLQKTFPLPHCNCMSHNNHLIIPALVQIRTYYMH
jgi:hypothetical protein